MIHCLKCAGILYSALYVAYCLPSMSHSSSEGMVLPSSAKFVSDALRSTPSMIAPFACDEMPLCPKLYNYNIVPYTAYI
jgi:hypothetical protein